MTVRTFPGTPTADLEVAWDVVATHERWKIEVHKEPLASLANKLVFWRDWNPVRLLGPDGTLWASAATVEEMKEALPELMTTFAAKRPLLTKEDLRKAGEALASILLAAASRKVNAPKAGR
jgi:hypothetical protein